MRPYRHQRIQCSHLPSAAELVVPWGHHRILLFSLSHLAGYGHVVGDSSDGAYRDGLVCGALAGHARETPANYSAKEWKGKSLLQVGRYNPEAQLVACDTYPCYSQLAGGDLRPRPPSLLASDCDRYLCDQPLAGRACETYPCDQPLPTDALQYPIDPPPMMMQREAASSTHFETDMSRIYADVGVMTQAVAAVSEDLVNIENDLQGIVDRDRTRPESLNFGVIGDGGVSGVSAAVNGGMNSQVNTNRPALSYASMQAGQEDYTTSRRRRLIKTNVARRRKTGDKPSTTDEPLVKSSAIVFSFSAILGIGIAMPVTIH